MTYQEAIENTFFSKKWLNTLILKEKDKTIWKQNSNELIKSFNPYFESLLTLYFDFDNLKLKNNISLKNYNNIDRKDSGFYFFDKRDVLLYELSLEKKDINKLIEDCLLDDSLIINKYFLPKYISTDLFIEKLAKKELNNKKFFTIPSLQNGKYQETNYYNSYYISEIDVNLLIYNSKEECFCINFNELLNYYLPCKLPILSGLGTYKDYKYNFKYSIGIDGKIKFKGYANRRSKRTRSDEQICDGVFDLELSKFVIFNHNENILSWT